MADDPLVFHLCRRPETQRDCASKKPVSNGGLRLPDLPGPLNAQVLGLQHAQVTVVPWLGTLSIFNVAPMIFARYCMMRRPIPWCFNRLVEKDRPSFRMVKVIWPLSSSSLICP